MSKRSEAMAQEGEGRSSPTRARVKNIYLSITFSKLGINWDSRAEYSNPIRLQPSSSVEARPLDVSDFATLRSSRLSSLSLFQTLAQPWQVHLPTYSCLRKFSQLSLLLLHCCRDANNAPNRATPPLSLALLLTLNRASTLASARQRPRPGLSARVRSRKRAPSQAKEGSPSRASSTAGQTPRAQENEQQRGPRRARTAAPRPRSSSRETTRMMMISMDCRSRTTLTTRMRTRTSLRTPTQKASRPLARTLAARLARYREKQKTDSISPPLAPSSTTRTWRSLKPPTSSTSTAKTMMMRTTTRRWTTSLISRTRRLESLLTISR